MSQVDENDFTLEILEQIGFGFIGADKWLILVREATSVANANDLAVDVPTATYMKQEQRRLQTRHIWETVNIRWPFASRQSENQRTIPELGDKDCLPSKKPHLDYIVPGLERKSDKP